MKQKAPKGRHIYSRGWSAQRARNPRKSFEERSNHEVATQRGTAGASISSEQLCHPVGVRFDFGPVPGVPHASHAPTPAIYAPPHSGLYIRPHHRRNIESNPEGVAQLFRRHRNTHCATPSGFDLLSCLFRGFRMLHPPAIYVPPRRGFALHHRKNGGGAHSGAAGGRAGVRPSRCGLRAGATLVAYQSDSSREARRL